MKVFFIITSYKIVIVGNKKIVTNNQLRYIIPIDPENGLIMISYTDDVYTKHWKNMQNNQKKLKKLKVKLQKNQ